MRIPLTVIGVDAKGHLFRESTMVQGLEGRDCQYQSKHEVRVDSVVLLDLDYTGAGQEPCRVQGRVKTLRTPRTDQGLFEIDVELDTLQSVKLVRNGQEDQVGKQDTPTPKPPVAAIEPKGMAPSRSPWREPAPQEKANADACPRPSTNPEATTGAEDHERLAKIETQILAITRAAAKAAVATEISTHLAALTAPLSGEMEASVQAAVMSGMDRMVHDAVEKQMAQQYQAGIQFLSAELTHELAERLSASQDLRTCVESMTAAMAERLSELSQAAALKIGEELNARAMAVRQLIEEAIAKTLDRANDSHANLGATLANAQAVGKEVDEAVARIQENFAQLRDADKIAAESFAKLLPLQLDAWNAEFDRRFDQATLEQTTRWASGIEREMLPYAQRAEEALEMLEAGLQLAQAQEGRLAALSQTAMTDFEKGIRSLFFRLSHNA